VDLSAQRVDRRYRRQRRSRRPPAVVSRPARRRPGRPITTARRRARTRRRPAVRAALMRTTQLVLGVEVDVIWRHTSCRDTAQPLQHTGIVDARAAPLRVAGISVYLSVRAQCTPVQRARHTQARAAAVRFLDSDELMLGPCTRIGGKSNTCRRSTLTSGAPANSAPHPWHGPGSCRSASSGSTTCSRVDPGAPACPPGLRPLLRRNDFSAGSAQRPQPQAARSGQSGCNKSKKLLIRRTPTGRHHHDQ
jgi:hypothetical protein